MIARKSAMAGRTGEGLAGVSGGFCIALAVYSGPRFELQSFFPRRAGGRCMRADAETNPRLAIEFEI
jgi:hypothetical protein